VSDRVKGLILLEIEESAICLAFTSPTTR